MRRRTPILNVPRAMGEMRSDYAAMRPSRFRRQRQGMGGTADAHYASDARFSEMREYARDMDRNDAIIGQAVDRACDNLVQTGFRLEVQTGDAKLDTDLWQHFEDWAIDADAADVQGEWTFRDYEWKLKRADFVDGDIFVLLTEDGQMEAVEACRCRTPRSTTRNVVHGVLLDDRRKRLEYWFTRDLIDPMQRVAKVADMVRYPVRDEDGGRQVCHIYAPQRFSQTRGVTVFAPVFDMAGMVEDVQFAKLVQQQMSSVFAAFLERTADYKLGNRSQEDLEDGTAADVEDLTPGLFLKGKVGEKLTLPSSNIPNAEYLPHLRSLIMLIGLRLHLPICVTLLDPSDTNFSGYRGAIDQARMSFRRAQAYFARRFHSPVYQWKVRQWIREDAALRNAAARMGKNILKHRWDAPGWPYIEPSKDAEADSHRLKNLLVSPRALHAERGRDWDDVYTETVEDNSKAILKAIGAAAAIEESTGVVVSWREVLNWSSPDGAPKKGEETATKRRSDEATKGKDPVIEPGDEEA